MEKIPFNYRHTYVEFIYNKYKNHRSFPLLKFLKKAQINYEELDFIHIKYCDNLIGILIDNRLNLSNKMIDNIPDIQGRNNNAELIE